MGKHSIYRFQSVIIHLLHLNVLAYRAASSKYKYCTSVLCIRICSVKSSRIFVKNQNPYQPEPTAIKICLKNMRPRSLFWAKRGKVTFFNYNSPNTPANVARDSWSCPKKFQKVVFYVLVFPRSGFQYQTFFVFGCSFLLLLFIPASSLSAQKMHSWLPFPEFFILAWT